MMSSLTIVLPTYNGARFLRQQLDSILAQSDPDFNLLVIDDGSTDDSVKIIDEYARLDGRISRLPSTGNEGQRRRIGELIDNVSTEYLAFADQDDIWEPDRNAKLLSAIGDKALAFGRSRLIDADGQPHGMSLLESLGINPFKASPLDSLFRPLVSAHAAIVRTSWLDRSVLSGALPFDHALGLAAQLSRGLVYVDDAVVDHRIHGGNQMNSTAANQKSGRWISPYRLRVSTGFVQFDRLSLYMSLDQLSRFSVIDADVRLTVSNAAAACRYTWFQRLKFTLMPGRRLERQLHSLLDRFAISQHDLDVFNYRIRSVTRAQTSLVNIVKGTRRYFKQTDLPAHLMG
jgi:glycosyltransferase involved in cell wall biosynthesis